MKKLMNRVVAVSLVFSLILLLTVSLSPTAFAAAGWPNVSSSAYCEITALNRVNVYQDSGLNTRGTSSPAKSYNAYIDAGDLCKIKQFSDDRALVAYPTSSGEKTGWVNTSSLLGCTAPTEQVTSNGKATTYRSAGGASIGYVASGDAVYKLYTSGSYVAVVYTAASGSRAYKFGFVSESDYNNTIRKNQQNSAPSVSSGSIATNVFNRIGEIAKGNRTIDSNTVMKVGSVFSGTRSDEQCKGYAKNVFKLLFGVTPGSTQSKPQNYLLNSVNGISLVSSVTDMNDTNVQNMFGSARPGDFVQIRRNHGGSHSAIVVKTTSSSVIFIEANLDGRNTISLNEYSWSDLCGSNAAMALYTASNYALA